jgi:hypothetical protein
MITQSDIVQICGHYVTPLELFDICGAIRFPEFRFRSKFNGQLRGVISISIASINHSPDLMQITFVLKKGEEEEHQTQVHVFPRELEEYFRTMDREHIHDTEGYDS